MNNQFDKCVQHLLPACPVLAGQKSGNNDEANIGSEKVFSIQIKTGRVRTGVDLRWYKQSEFKKLTKDQKEKLIDWGKTQAGLAAKQAWYDSRKKNKGNNTNKNKNNSNRDGEPKLSRASKSQKQMAEAVASSVTQALNPVVSALKYIAPPQVTDTAKDIVYLFSGNDK